MSRGVVAVQPTADGFDMLCDCGVTMAVTIAWENERGESLADAPDGTTGTVAAQEVAITCDGCKSVHWIRISPHEVPS